MIRLYATPLSHFSRKVRILLDLYEIPYELRNVGNVADITKDSPEGQEQFGTNPLMKVPTLVDGETWMIESDHIAQFIVRKRDIADRYRVLATDVPTLNMRAVLNGVMQEEAKLILAKRTGVPTEQFRYFEKAHKALANGLSWAEVNASLFQSESPGYLEFHLLCLWDHLDYYKLVDLNYSRLQKIVATLRKDPVLQMSSPEASIT